MNVIIPIWCVTLTQKNKLCHSIANPLMEIVQRKKHSRNISLIR